MPSVNLTQDEIDAIFWMQAETSDKVENCNDPEYIADYKDHTATIRGLLLKFQKAQKTALVNRALELAKK